MRAKHLFDKRVAVLLMIAAVAVGVSSCTAPPPSSPAAAPAPAQSTGPANSQLSAIVQAMNADRAAAGLGPLAWNDQLGGSGAIWAGSIANGGSLVHQDLGAILSQPAYMAYRTLGENLLMGPTGMSTAAMESAWMNSPGHRANILQGAFTMAGVGITVSGGRVWVAVEFGG